MAKSLNYNITESFINSKSSDFWKLLQHSVNTKVLGFIDSLNNNSDLYVFSGVIRNYFLKRNLIGIRDLDLLIDDQSGNAIDLLLANGAYKYKKNSFGGFKIVFEDFIIDVWYLKNTWGLKHINLPFDNNFINAIIDTPFFNFSSIVFSIKKQKFIFNNYFIDFLKTKQLKIVLKENPNVALCIINTIYYSRRYKLSISYELKHYLIYEYNRIKIDFKKIQIKHFGCVMYSNDELSEYIKKLSYSK